MCTRGGTRGQTSGVILALRTRDIAAPWTAIYALAVHDTSCNGKLRVRITGWLIRVRVRVRVMHLSKAVSMTALS